MPKFGTLAYFGIIASIAVCLTNGLFALYIVLSGDYGAWWLAAMEIAPPLMVFVGLERQRKASQSGE